MPMEAVITCLSPTLRDAFAQQLQQIEDDGTRELATQLLEGLADCQEGESIGLRFQESGEAGNSKGKRRRKPSAYNLFVRDCMKSEPGITLQECARRWNHQKAQRQAPSQ